LFQTQKSNWVITAAKTIRIGFSSPVIVIMSWEMSGSGELPDYIEDDPSRMTFCAWGMGLWRKGAEQCQQGCHFTEVATV